jgi:hypothetical protein
MPNFTTHLTTAASSVPGVSTVCPLNWMGGQPTTVHVFPSTTGSASAAFRLEFSLDDPSLVPSSAIDWRGLSSNTGLALVAGSAAASIYWSSTTGIDGLLYTFPGPLGAVRLNSTALSSGPLTMQVLQGEGGD